MSEESPNSSESPAPRKGVSKGMLSVLGIIAVFLAVLAYDFLVVSPNVQGAFDQIVKKSIDSKMNDAELSNTEVQELIGKTPSDSYDDDFGDTVEVYEWGLPFKKHKLFAIYKNTDGKLSFRRHSIDAYSKGDGVIVEINPDDPGDAMEMGGGDSMAAGGGGPTEYSAPPADASEEDAGEDNAEENDEDNADADESAEPSGEGADGSQPPAESDAPSTGEDTDGGGESESPDEPADESSDVLPSKQSPN